MPPGVPSRPAPGRAVRGVPGLHELREGDADAFGVLAGGGRQLVQGGEDLLRFAQVVDQVVDESVDEGAGAEELSAC